MQHRDMDIQHVNPKQIFFYDSKGQFRLQLIRCHEIHFVARRRQQEIPVPEVWAHPGVRTDVFLGGKQTVDPLD